MVSGARLRIVAEADETPGVGRDVDLGSVYSYRNFGFVPAPGSIFGGLLRLPPGHLAKLRADGSLVEPLLGHDVPGLVAAARGRRWRWVAMNSPSRSEIVRRVASVVYHARLIRLQRTPCGWPPTSQSNPTGRIIGRPVLGGPAPCVSACSLMVG
jgi:hypothetical protein